MGATHLQTTHLNVTIDIKYKYIYVYVHTCIHVYIFMYQHAREITSLTISLEGTKYAWQWFSDAAFRLRSGKLSMIWVFLQIGGALNLEDVLIQRALLSGVYIEAADF